MLAAKQALVKAELESGTGAEVSVATVQTGLRSGLKMWFSDLDESHGPMVCIAPHGLRGFRVSLAFGKFSGTTIRQIAVAPEEDKLVARALIGSIPEWACLNSGGEPLSQDWHISAASFRLDCSWKYESGADEESELVRACHETAVPMLAAMAELIGYDQIEPTYDRIDGEIEGQIKQSVVRARERNPRNRLLALRLHEYACVVCGVDPRTIYRTAGEVIEIHHLQPLSLQGEPRVYDPRTDLVPVCPTCHRALHTSRPVPLTPSELRALMGFSRQ